MKQGGGDVKNKKTAEGRRPWYTKVVKSQEKACARVVSFKVVDVVGTDADIAE